MAAKLEGLRDLMTEDLQDVYDAEKQLVRALPKIAKAATDEELQNALREHLEITKGQVERLERVFAAMDMRPRSKPCKGMKGIVEEGQEMIGEERKETLLDPAIAAAARKVEHYEMASYETLRGMARQLRLPEVAQLLEETLREEMEADKQLAQISKRLLKGAESRREPQPEGKSSRTRGKQQSKARKSRTTSGGGHTSHPLTDPEEIRRWAEERGAKPACVRGTGGKGDIGMLRLDFPGYSGEESLEPISWDDWLEKFDERGLALLVQDTTASGQRSNFNKLVSRETIRKAAH